MYYVPVTTASLRNLARDNEEIVLFRLRPAKVPTPGPFLPGRETAQVPVLYRVPEQNPELAPCWAPVPKTEGAAIWVWKWWVSGAKKAHELDFGFRSHIFTFTPVPGPARRSSSRSMLEVYTV